MPVHRYDTPVHREKPCANAAVRNDGSALRPDNTNRSGTNAVCLYEVPTNVSVAAVEAVPQEKLSRYGVVGGTWERPGSMRVDIMVEKPAPGTAPGEFAVASRYVFTPEIFPALHATLPGKNNEIQLTDAMKHLAASGRLNARVIDGKRYDLGSKSGFITANVDFALRRSELAGDIETELEQILQKRKNNRV